jgi:predicted transposase/invertase (TIGR01784 family)
MQSDSFICQFFKRLPQTLFEMLRLPRELAKAYDFDPVEIKKSYRLDGLFRPKRGGLPAYFVEVQFYFLERFYAGLFAKVCNYLNDNPEIPDWHAVAIFEKRGLEPAAEPFEDLVNSRRVTRIYLDELETTEATPVGIRILKLVCEKEAALPGLVKRVLRQIQREIPDQALSRNVVELVEEVLIRRFVDLNREEIRKMFHLTDIRKTAVWREAEEGGIEKGRAIGRGEGREEGAILAKQTMARNCLAKGMPVNEIADLVDLPIKEVRRIAKEKKQ